MLRFVVSFAVLLVLFYAATATPVFQQRIFPGYLKAYAATSAWVLAGLGEEARASGFLVASPKFRLEIRRGCDAVEPSALFAAAVLAFPVPWRRRIGGAAAGLLGLAVLNLVRIVSLYYTGVHAPSIFETVHVEVWQPVFVLSAMLAWVAWAVWAGRRREQAPDGQ